MRWRALLAASLCAAAVFGSAAAARADVSVDAGAFVTGSKSDVGGLLSVGIYKPPVIPLAGEITAAVQATGGYAATADFRVTAASTTLGAGIGFGSLGTPGGTRALYDVILAQSVAPHFAVEARVYFGSARPTTVFAGLRLSL
ncbi:MAG: hypothetical protein JOY59_00770 [Candidatus Eremiobacteraeota bacterium]|nr:hypothetical protein [Candidatus Eremiobacteraeota bacterium]